MAANDSKPIANPMIVLREEFDDWAILFDPDSGEGHGLNPVSVFIWKLLDGKHTTKDIMAKLIENCDDMPDDAESLVETFVKDLVERGFAGYEA